MINIIILNFCLEKSINDINKYSAIMFIIQIDKVKGRIIS